MNILGIIPARGGSKRVPKKNIKKIVGKPLIFYTISEANKSKYFTRIVVSTENQEIAKISKKYGVSVIPRPKKLALDKTPSENVFLHVIKYLKKKENFKTDIFVVLQPTSPLRTVNDIDGAIEKFLKTDCDSLVSVTKVQHSPYWIYRLDKNKLKKQFRNKIIQQQESPLLYQINGAIYITYEHTFIKKNKLIDKNTYGYIMPPERSVDIDSPFDLKITKLLMKEKSKRIK